MKIGQTYLQLHEGKRIVRKITDVDDEFVSFNMSLDEGKTWAPGTPVKLDLAKRAFGERVGRAARTPKATPVAKPNKTEDKAESKPDVSLLIERIVRRVVKEELAKLTDGIDAKLANVPALVDKRIKDLLK